MEEIQLLHLGGVWDSDNAGLRAVEAIMKKTIIRMPRRAATEWAALLYLLIQEPWHRNVKPSHHIAVCVSGTLASLNAA